MAKCRFDAFPLCVWYQEQNIVYLDGGSANPNSGRWWMEDPINQKVYLSNTGEKCKNMKRPYKQKIEGKNTDVGLF